MSVSLSDLPRAAMSAKEGYWWINGAALTLSVVVAHMSWSAYSADGHPDRALVCIVTQVLAITSAILARRALTGQMPIAAIAAAVLTAGCAWWASHGLALTWYGDADRNGEPMVIFIAALEPALFLLAEHIKEGRETLRTAYEKSERETAEELAAIRARQSVDRPPRQPFQPEVVEGGRSGQALAGVTAASVALAGGVTDRAPEAVSFQPPNLPTVSHSEQTWANPEAHAKALLAEGRSQREAARLTGLTRYMVGQIASGSVAA